MRLEVQHNDVRTRDLRYDLTVVPEEIAVLSRHSGVAKISAAAVGYLQVLQARHSCAGMVSRSVLADGFHSFLIRSANAPFWNCFCLLIAGPL